MRISLYFLLLFVLFGYQAHSQITSNQAGCTYYWQILLNGESLSSNTDTIYCHTGDQIKMGMWQNGGNCPDVVNYDWYFSKLVCNQLSEFVPDTSVIGHNPSQYGTEWWFQSTEFTGDITLHAIHFGTCLDLTIIRSEPASAGLLDSEEWALFYTPVSQQIRIKTQKSNSYQLNLYSMDGRIIRSHQEVGNQQTDVSGLPSGIYIASIETEKGVLRKKLMIQTY